MEVGSTRWRGCEPMGEALPQAATARAKRECEVAPVNEEAFLFLVHQTPYFAIAVMRPLADLAIAADASHDRDESTPSLRLHPCRC
jgi:CRP-like cAMP-binding protein